MLVYQTSTSTNSTQTLYSHFSDQNPKPKTTMVDHCNPLNWAYLYQDEGIEELRQQLFCKTELEAAILTAREEITKREYEILHLKDLLFRTIKERNEAQAQCQQLMLNKLLLHQQLLLQQNQNQQQQQQQQQEPQNQNQEEEIRHLKQEEGAPLASSSEDESNHMIIINSPDNHHQNHHNHSGQTTTSSSSSSSPLPEVILKLAADKPLPEQGKLLQAVKEAGPLLQTLLLAGPLPQWQHPPPPLDSIDIPPVTISSPNPKLLIHQESFNNSSFTTHSCLNKKRDLEFYDQDLDSCSPTNKYQKIILH